MNRNELKTAFEQIEPKYRRLAENVKEALAQFLADNRIDYFDIEARVKTFESFSSKVRRKGYDDPLVDITDICGLRIINYYPSDLESISSIIKHEFEIFESSNKEEEMDDDRFGYRSLHFVGAIKKEWIGAPNYRELEGLKFEIQVRTILMHGWAVISHKLAYKHEDDVPKKFRRNLFRLSALFEMADEQFENLREERKKYAQSFVESGAGSNGKFIPSEELNSDSLQALLDYYFPDRSKSDGVSSLVSEIRDLDMGLSDFNDAVISVIDNLDEIEREENQVVNKDIVWSQDGAARTVLDITNDDYFSRNQSSSIPSELLDVLRRWRERINAGG